MSDCKSLSFTSSAIFTLQEIISQDEIVELLQQARKCLDTSKKFIIHSSDDGENTDLADLYEPAGRREAKADRVLQTSLEVLVERANHRTRHKIPSFTVSEWYIFEYSTGQFIIPHADGSGKTPNSVQHENIQEAALSLTLESAENGGEFYIQTEPCINDWENDVRTGLDPTSSSYNRTDSPKWTLQNFSAGDALIFGSEVIHGTHPVISGQAIKVIGFISFTN